MERLTKISEIGNAYYPKCFEEPCCGMGECLDDKCSLILDVCKKLAEYEQLEEQGLLVRLPCKLNGTLYSVNYSNKTIAENTIIKISINDHVKRFYCIDDNLRERIFFSYRIGENVFLTREEAEKKLEELKNEI